MKPIQMIKFKFKKNKNKNKNVLYKNAKKRREKKRVLNKK